MKKIFPKRSSMKTFFIIAVPLCILLPVIITNFVFFNIFSDTYNDENMTAISMNAESLNNSLNEYLEKYSIVFTVIENSPVWDQITEINNANTVEEVKDYYTDISMDIPVLEYVDHANNYKALVNLIDSYESTQNIRAIYIGTPSKYVFTNDQTRGYTVLYGYNNGEETTTFDCTTRPWYTGAVSKNGDIYWSETYLDKDGKSIVLSASKAIYDDQDELVAVISIDILNDKFSNQIANFLFDSNYSSSIINESGTFIFTRNELIGETLDNPKLITFLSSTDEYIQIEDNIYTKAQNRESGWYILYSYDSSHVITDMLIIVRYVAILALAIVLFIIVAVLLTLNLFINPLVKLTEHFKIIDDQNNLSLELPPYNHNNEIGLLYKSVYNMQNSVKNSIKRVEYLIFHDTLTKISNRSFFEKQLELFDNEKYLPLSVVMIDLNGLKLINDAFGHEVGDEYLRKTGEILTKNTRIHDVVSRWGGDEFVLLLPNTTGEIAKNVISRIQNSTKNQSLKYGDISLAIGVATKKTVDEDFKATLKLAEELMYQEKNNVYTSSRSETIHTIITTLFEKSSETEQHSKRVSELATLLAKAMNLPENKVNDISTIGIIHDIGKIVIDSSILDKKSSFTAEEIEIMRSHPVIGSRILSSTNKYTRLIPGLLHHHERIDGTGYPDKLKGDEIPLESKIICVVDAFDAMISLRPYKEKAMTKEEAVEELISCSGTQFDRKIVDIFIKEVIPDL